MQFLQQADAFMAGVLQKLDALDPDELEAELGMGVLKIEFADGRKCVMNRQTAAHQIWLAEGATAWHFAWDDDARDWLDTKGRGSLRAVLEGVLSHKLRRPIRL
jgi:iron-sulfur cluster assembly protein CyaY